MTAWVLIEAVSSKPDRPLYYLRWTGIGPQTTPLLDEAATYETEQQAMQSPAFSFPLAVFRTKEIALVGDDTAAEKPSCRCGHKFSDHVHVSAWGKPGDALRCDWDDAGGCGCGDYRVGDDTAWSDDKSTGRAAGPGKEA